MQKIRGKIIASALVLLVMLVSIPVGIVEASSFSVSSSSGSVSSGGSFTVSVNSGGLTGKFDVSVSNGSASAYSVWLEGGSSSVTITAGGSGTTTVTVTAADVTDSSYNSVTGSKSVSVSVAGAATPAPTPTPTPSTPSEQPEQESPEEDDEEEEDEEEKSSNNNLASLTVSEGTLSPAFSAGVTEYQVNVVDVTAVTINASAADAKSTVSGTGEKALVAGANEAIVTVTAENQSTKSYKIVINLEEKPTVFSNYGDQELGVVKNPDDVMPPAGFEVTTTMLGGEEIIAWTNPATALTVAYLINGEGVADFYVIDGEEITSVYRATALLGLNVIILDIPEEEQTRDGYVYQDITVDGVELKGWAFEDPALADYVRLQVINEQGQPVEYLYSISGNTMIIAPDLVPMSQEMYDTMMAEEVNEDDSEGKIEIPQQWAIIGGSVAGGLLLLLIILTAVTASKNSKYKKRLSALASQMPGTNTEEENEDLTSETEEEITTDEADEDVFFFDSDIEDENENEEYEVLYDEDDEE